MMLPLILKPDILKNPSTIIVPNMVNLSAAIRHSPVI